MQKKVEINDRDFFRQPLSRVEIQNLLQGRPASEMFNYRSPSFKKMGVNRDKLSDNNLMELMLKEPSLIHRPVVRIGKKVYFGATSKVLADILKL